MWRGARISTEQHANIFVESVRIPEIHFRQSACLTKVLLPCHAFDNEPDIQNWTQYHRDCKSNSMPSPAVDQITVPYYCSHPSHQEGETQSVCRHRQNRPTACPILVTTP